ncbi:MAG: tetratricopeptide repeat protein, partial [Oceanobacter sp.]
NLIVPGLDTGPIEKLSQQMGVPWRPISLLDNDWQALLDQRPIGPNQSQTGNPDDAPEILFDQWKDQGHWLMLLLLPLALMSFRRGWLFSLVLAVPLLNPQPAAALDLQQGWRSLWQTPDQQAAELLQQDPQQAAQTFEDPGWKGSAAYQAGDYEQAAKAFAKDQSPNAQYNRGNALAQAGKLEQALEAYDQALAANPDNQDAIYNRKLVEEALKQKQQQEQSENQNQQGDQQQNQDGEQSDSQNSQGDNSQNQNNQSQQGSDSSQDQQDSRDKKQQDPKNKDGQDAQNSEQSKADEQNSDQSEDERQQASQARKEDGDGESDSNQPPENATAMENPLEDMDASEQMQLKQWLNRVPDQPGKLLQRKFLYQYSKQADQNEPEQQVW